MANQLDDAYEQVNGAREHLDHLRPEIEAFRKMTLNAVSITREPATYTSPAGKQMPTVMGRLSATHYPTPPRTKRLIGDTVQNLRAALDYLIYEVCRFDAKGDVKQTQFVIADSEDDFVKNCKRRFRGMSAEHVAVFQKLQPYAGCRWTAVLRDLSNPSKHEHLTGVNHPVRVSLSPGSTDAILAGEKVDVKSDVSMDVAFSDGTLVIEQLEQLITNVAQLLHSFDHLFR